MEQWELNSYVLHSRLPRYRRMVEQAQSIIEEVLKLVKNPYVAFSCGKDSSVLAHLVLQQAPDTPLRFLSSGETRLVHNVDTVLEHFRVLGATIQEINIDRVFSEEWKDATWTEQRKAGKRDLEKLNDPVFDCIFMGLRMEESRPRKMSLLRHRDEDLPRYCHRYKGGNRQAMIRCCPLANWTTKDVGAYLLENGLPWLDWYDFRGFEGRTTARLTGDAVRQNTLTWIKLHKPEHFNILTARFPELRSYV